MNQIITLLSDWRLRDPYVAMLKGRILQTLPDAQIIDITHYVDKFNLPQTAFQMRASYDSFPEGTIHLILTNMSLHSTFPPVLLCHDGHYFIGEDNGVFHLMFGQTGLLKGLQLSEEKGDTLSQMLSLAKAIKEDTLGQQTKEYAQFKRMFVELPDHEAGNKQIEGHIIYIDAFNNAVTDIPATMFEKVVQGRPFTATILSKGTWTITKYYGDYHVSDGEMFLCRNSLGLIEVAAYQSDVAILTDLEPGERIIINYE